MKVKLSDLAHARSGDKGDNCNIGVIAKSSKDYQIILHHLTTKVVKDYFNEFCLGTVERYELANIEALNFVLKQTLAGGGTSSLRIDTQGKTLAAALLNIELDV